jgi:hypothetical protein
MTAPHRTRGVAASFALAAALNGVLVGLLWAPDRAETMTGADRSLAPLRVSVHVALPAAPPSPVIPSQPLPEPLQPASTPPAIPIVDDEGRHSPPISSLEISPQAPLKLEPGRSADSLPAQAVLILQIELDAQGRIHAAYPVSAPESEAFVERVRLALLGRVPSGPPAADPTSSGAPLCIQIQLDPSSTAQWHWLESCPF